MQNKISNFQMTLLVVFGLFILVGLGLFATSTLKPSTAALDPIVVWGTAPADIMSKLVSGITDKEKDTLKLTYVEKDSNTFDRDLVEAIANGVGPDVILLPQDLVVKEKQKIFTIPYTSYPLRTFTDTFIDAGNIYVNSDGVQAVPFIVDPLVLYWNKNHFVNANIVNPPYTWEDFSADVLKLTKKDSNFNVTQSGAALGGFGNVSHAKDILATLFLQGGTPIVAKDTQGRYESRLQYSATGVAQPAQSALVFFTDFSDTSKTVYTWNKSLRNSFDMFTSGDLSMYLGFASELPMISMKNPNLNFDVSTVPQVKGTPNQVVFARMYGLAILKSSKYQSSAFTQIAKLTTKDSIDSLTALTGLPPVRRDALAVSPASAYMQVFYNAALRSKAWLDPDPSFTTDIFKNMVESTVTGKLRAGDAVNVADREILNFVQQIK